MSILVDNEWCYEIACDNTMYRIYRDEFGWEIQEYVLRDLFIPDIAWPPSFLPDKEVETIFESYYERL